MPLGPIISGASERPDTCPHRGMIGQWFKWRCVRCSRATKSFRFGSLSVIEVGLDDGTVQRGLTQAHHQINDQLGVADSTSGSLRLA